VLVNIRILFRQGFGFYIWKGSFEEHSHDGPLTNRVVDR